MLRLTTFLLTLTFLIPAPLLAQESARAAAEDTPVTIPIYPFLEHSSTTAYGLFVATPLDDETMLWAYDPFAEAIGEMGISPIYSGN